MGGLTKREIETQTEGVGQIERRKDINVVQWPVSRERIPRQSTPVTTTDMKRKEHVCC